MANDSRTRGEGYVELEVVPKHAISARALENIPLHYFRADLAQLAENAEVPMPGWRKVGKGPFILSFRCPEQARKFEDYVKGAQEGLSFKVQPYGAEKGLASC